MPGVRAIPWIASAALHAALVMLLVAAAFRAPPPPANARVVDILVVSSRGNAAPHGGEGAPRQAGRNSVRPAAPGGQRAAFDADHGATSSERAASASPFTAALPLPAAEDVLSDVPSEAAASSYGAMATGEQGGDQFGWEGSTRKLISGRNPVFPAILSAAGQEVECQARITVSSSGKVTHVEIVRSSGYIEIDASVEAALRDYLFSRVDGRKDAVGTVRFHFRLERQD
jgi:TonB family protein